MHAMDLPALLSWTFAALLALLLACTALLRAWGSWLELKRFEMAAGTKASRAPGAMSRAELASLRERVRRLEAIASGIDPAG